MTNDLRSREAAPPIVRNRNSAPANEPSAPAWDAIAESKEFKDLMATKRVFIVPAVLFFLLFYFALPALVGYAPGIMTARVGPVNLAYLFALAQFFVAWMIAGLYVKAANSFDRLSKDIVDRAQNRDGGK